MYITFTVNVKADRFQYRSSGKPEGESSIEIDIEEIDAEAVIGGASSMLQSMAKSALAKYNNPPQEEEAES